MQQTEIKKLFAVLDKIQKRLNDLENGDRLDRIEKRIKEITAYSEIVAECVVPLGSRIDEMSKKLRRLNLRCPLMKPDTSEVKKLCDPDG